MNRAGAGVPVTPPAHPAPALRAGLMTMVDKVRSLVGGKDAVRPENDELEQLKNRLRVIYRRQGEQSYRVLAAQTGLSAATISRIFNATKPPKWNNLQRVLAALGVTQGEQESDWHPLWSSAQDRIKPLGEAASFAEKPSPPRDPQKTICQWCGVEVEAARADVHATWHKELTERIARIDGLLRAIEHRMRRLPLGIAAPPSQGLAGAVQPPPAEAAMSRPVATGKRTRGGKKS
jgi:transcriptional regulator with XRE-family HTH domain